MKVIRNVALGFILSGGYSIGLSNVKCEIGMGGDAQTLGCRDSWGRGKMQGFVHNTSGIVSTKLPKDTFLVDLEKYEPDGGGIKYKEAEVDEEAAEDIEEGQYNEEQYKQEQGEQQYASQKRKAPTEGQRYMEPEGVDFQSQFEADQAREKQTKIGPEEQDFQGGQFDADQAKEIEVGFDKQAAYRISQAVVQSRSGPSQRQTLHPVHVVKKGRRYYFLNVKGSEVKTKKSE